MNDHDINTLKNLDTPEPSEHARQCALNAALMAFDEAEETQKNKSFKKNYQGNFSPIRLMTSFLQMTGEWIMRRSLLAGTAVALVLAAPVAFFVVNQSPHTQDVEQNAKTDKKPLVETPETKTVTNSNIKQSEDDQKRLKELGYKLTYDTRNHGKVSPTERKHAPVKQKPKDKSISELWNSPLGPLRADYDNVIKKEDGDQKEAFRFGGDMKGFANAKQDPPQKRIQAPKSITNIVIQSVPANKPATGVQLRKASEKRARREQSITGVLTSSERVPVSEKEVEYADDNYTTRDRYPEFKPNPVTPVRDKPVSTFSIDVDTASYAVMRRSLNQGRMPKAASVRVEELINYFTYNYQLPKNADRPFKATTSVFTTPWNKHTKLLHIGIKGHDIVKKDKPRSNLVFLIDVSGSMSSRDKLPLLVSAFKLLVNKLEPEDTISIVTYAGRAGTVLKPTKISEKQKILEALNNLKSGGSTAGAQGIEQAYKLARENFDEEGVNRVILATDGDFNVGMTNHDELKSYIEKQRKSGIFLSVLGFGQGNYNDSLMQILAQNGNGTAAYIDSLKEAQKVLVDEAGSTLFTIAKDVKIQIEFNPAKVAEYRLIGYETRALKREDFNNDKVDAGDIGSGHAVTAIYEITPVDSPAKSVDDLRYADNKNEQDQKRETAANTNEYAFLKLRYKLPKESKSKLIKIPVTTEQDKTEEALSEDTRFATAVAAFGQKIKGNQHLSDFTYDQIHKLASEARGKDTFGYRSEFLSLIRLAKSLTNRK